MALDADGDGEISASEIDGAVAALKKLDKNSDGKLTMDELMPEGMPGFGGPANPEEMVARMMAADVNGDGFIDESEMPERMKPMLTRADADKDGKLSKEELMKMVSEMGPRRGPGGFGPRGDRGNRRGDGAEGTDDDGSERPRRPRSE
jgi:Ca2+-binding EF-hand superfamily protein